jgi:hypothetical protein
MASVQVLRLETPKSSLAALPEAERRLVLLLGQAVNEISTLNRLLLFSLEKQWPDEVTERIAIGRAWVIVPLLGHDVRFVVRDRQGLLLGSFGRVGAHRPLA